MVTVLLFRPFAYLKCGKSNTVTGPFFFSMGSPSPATSFAPT
jgi:hypothetical protein